MGHPMRTLKTLLFASLLLVVAACTGGGTTLTTLAEQIEEETGTDVGAAIATAQAAMSEIAQQIEASEASQEVQEAWESLEADLTELFTSLQSGGTVDATQVQEILDDFETQLDELGDEVGPELRDAWESLRTQIEQLIEQAG
jgi:hypothetical protein